MTVIRIRKVASGRPPGGREELLHLREGARGGRAVPAQDRARRSGQELRRSRGPAGRRAPAGDCAGARDPGKAGGQRHQPEHHRPEHPGRGIRSAEERADGPV